MHESTDLPCNSICSDAASQDILVDTYSWGLNPLGDANFTRAMHACDPENADKPERSTNQATCHLPGWVPGAPLWEQPGSLDGSFVLPSSAPLCSLSLSDNGANTHRKQRSRSPRSKASTGGATDAPTHASTPFTPKFDLKTAESVHAE